MTGKRPLVRQGEGRLWLKWVLAYAVATVLAVLVGSLILALVPSLTQLDEMAQEALGSTAVVCLYAFLLGTLQWLILRQRSFRYFTWVGATVGGAIVYSVLVYVALPPAWSQSPGIWARTAASTLSGASIGTAQWLLLRRRFSGAGWWIPAVVAGAALEPILDQVATCLALLAPFSTSAFTGTRASIWACSEV